MSTVWKVEFCERCFSAFDYIPARRPRIYCDECRRERKREVQRQYKSRRVLTTTRAA